MISRALLFPLLGFLFLLIRDAQAACEIPDLSALTHRLTIPAGSYPEGVVSEQWTIPFPGSPGCRYQLRVTIEAQLRNNVTFRMSGSTPPQGDSFDFTGGWTVGSLSGNPGTYTTTATFNCFVSSCERWGIGVLSFGTQLPAMYIEIKSVEFVGTVSEDGTLCSGDCLTSSGLPSTRTHNDGVDVSIAATASDFTPDASFLRILAQPQPPPPPLIQSVFASTPPTVQRVYSRTEPATLRQLSGPQGLTEVLPVNDSTLQIQVFPPSAVGPPVQGLFSTTAPPIASYTLTYPNGPADTNLLHFIESRGTSPITNEYVWNPLSRSFTLNRANGTCQDALFNTTHLNIRTQTRILCHTNGPVIATKTSSQFQSFPWGEAQIQERRDPDGVNWTTSYQYWTNRSDPGYAQIKQVVYPFGDWRYYDYAPSGLISRTLAPFLNQPPTTDTNLCRVTFHDYTPLPGSGDTGLLETNKPRAIIQTLLGAEISRKYFVYLEGEEREILCSIPGAAWNHPSNLVTVTKRFTSGSFSNKLSSVHHPDGTLTLYSYATNAAFLTNTLSRGQPNADATAILRGSTTTEVLNLAGQPVWRSTTDLPSGLLTSSESFSDFDLLLRPQRVTFLDGTYKTTLHGCCGPESVRDRDGTVTDFFYDDLKRLSYSVSDGITNAYTYDPASRPLTHTRIAAHSLTVSAKAYNPAGDLVAETNALGVVTTYSQTLDGSGQLVRTTTLAAFSPDPATRIETFARDGTLLKVAGTAVHGTRYTLLLEPDAGVPRLTRHEIKLDAAGNDTAEISKTYTDFLGRDYKTLHPLSPAAPTTRSYNARGLLTRETDPDSITRLFDYDALAQPELSVLDMDRNGVIDLAGIDRITQTLRDVFTHYGTTVHRTRNFSWPVDHVNSNLLERTFETSVDGLRSWETLHVPGGPSLVRTTSRVIDPSGAQYLTNTAPDRSFTLECSLRGKRLWVRSFDASPTPVLLAQTTFTYDPFGRLATATDLRNGTTSYSYDPLDRVISVTSPPAGNGQPAQTTTTHYDPRGFVSRVTHPDGASVTQLWFPTGLLRKTSGARTYPVEYTYDGQGRVLTLKTWTNAVAAPSNAATTTWRYDPYRGFLTHKLYHDQTGPTYTYTPAGRLLTRTWARGVVTSHTYNNAGELRTTGYSDSSAPPLSRSYDRRGRLIHIDGDTHLDYNSLGLLAQETSALLPGFSLTHTYDALGRRDSYSLRNNGTLLGSTTVLSYDNASRLSSVSDGVHSALYAYVAFSSLVSHITFQQSGTTRMTTTRQFDSLNRLQSIVSTPASGSPASYHYTYNDANQRLRSTLPDGSFWVYDYDPLGQLRSGKRYWADQTPVAGQQFEYAHDDIGNRTSTKTGGDAAGSGLRTATYDANALNQYTRRTVPPVVDVVGVAHPQTLVTVNSVAAYRKGEYFHSPVTFTGSGPSFPTVTIATASTNLTKNVFLPASPEAYAYDLDGNLLSDGRFTYTWDAENRLIAVLSRPDAPAADKKSILYTYDHRSRRIRTDVSLWNGSAYVLTTRRHHHYDGWRLIAETDANHALVRSFRWGLDLSGTPEAAGGIGGLLAVTQSPASTHFVAYDGNGNVTRLINAATGATSAHYEFGPFGEPIRQTGPAATLNPFRWSTKFTEDETGFLYYGYRFYNPNSGRWLNRDPIGEKGGVNPYSAVAGNPITTVDILGLWEEDGHFYAVYILARLNGISVLDAYTLAYYSQYPDENPTWDAYEAGTRIAKPFNTNDGFDKDIQDILHSLHGGGAASVNSRRRCLEQLLSTPAGMLPWQKGLLLHALGDSFAHTRPDGSAYGSPMGHILNPGADDPAEHPDLFGAYLQRLNHIFGGQADADAVTSVAAALTSRAKNRTAAIAAARRLARHQYAYRHRYDPSEGSLLDPSMPQPTPAEVKAFMYRVKAACCALR